MSELRICEGLEIININGKVLETLKAASNSIDTGSQLVIDGLLEFIEVLEDDRKYSNTSYEKLFKALKQIIKSASETKSVKEAVMTGCINMSKMKNYPVSNSKPKTVSKVRRKKRKNESRDIEAVRKYAKTHTTAEICKKYNFSSSDNVKWYLRYHNIEFIKIKAGRKPDCCLDVESVREMGKTMQLSELCRTYAVTLSQMRYFCKKNNIEYQTQKGLLQKKIQGVTDC